MLRQVHGILLLDKPENMTSNYALQSVKRLFRAKKAGHTGSLDPIATGMLPLCFGEATKFSQFLLESDKFYDVTAKLGEETATGDSEGSITSVKEAAHITEGQIKQVIAQFVGEIEQIPPMYSAIKYHGKPLYQLARKGIEVERKARRTKIFSIEFISLINQTFNFKVHCSKGTYVRTLVEDIGRQLQCGAHVIGLRRLSVSPYSKSSMYTLVQIEKIISDNGLPASNGCLLPIESSVQMYPALQLSTSAAFYLRMGQAVRMTLPITSNYVRLFTEDKKFLGIGMITEDGRVKPHRLVATN